MASSTRRLWQDLVYRRRARMHASRIRAISSDHQYTAPARRGAPDRGILESQIACKSHLSRVAPASASSSDGDSFDQATAIVTVAMKFSSSSPSRWAGWSARTERRVAHRTPNRHLHQDVEVVREGLLRGHAPSGNTAGCGWTCPREVYYGRGPATPRTCWFISRRSNAAAQTCTSRPLPLVLQEPHAVE